MNKNESNRKKRHFRIRKKVKGTSEIPRLNVRRTITNLHVQIIDDVAEKTLVGVSTHSQDVKKIAAYGGNVNAAKALGEVLAAKMKEKGIEKICFDRGGYQYHGRVKALADTLRSNGIKF